MILTTDDATGIASDAGGQSVDDDSTTLLSIDVPIIVLASACWESPMRVNVHHIANRFAARGHQVLFVESTGLRGPVANSSNDVSRIRRRLSDWRKGPQRIKDNLHVLSPLALPWSWPRPCRSLSMRWLARQVARAARSLDFDRPILWTFLPNFARVAQSVNHRLLIYHCVDHYAANPGVDRAWVEQLEADIAHDADCVFATSHVLAERLQSLCGHVHLLPNVADVSLFARAVTDRLPEPAALRDIPHPRAVYVGNMAAYRIDFELLDALAHRRPDVHIVFIGVVGHGDVDTDSSWTRLAQRSNVHPIGPVDHGELPAHLKHCDVALIPFLDNEHTRGSLPMKLWEYAAAGLPVVATDLPNFREAHDEGVARLAGSRNEIITCVDDALAEHASQRGDRLSAARRHDWSSRIETMSGIVARAIQLNVDRES